MAVKKIPLRLPERDPLKLFVVWSVLHFRALTATGLKFILAFHYRLKHSSSYSWWLMAYCLPGVS